MPDTDIQYPTQAYIGGRWCDASDGQTFDVTNPATGEIIATVADCGADETRTAIAAADAAQKTWAGWTASDRANALKRWRDLMVAQADRLARILMLENGKPLAEARGEILYGASYLEWFAEEARRIYGDVIPAPAADKRIVVIRQPVGVCGAITPWNFPNAMLARKAAAALAAGCTMVAKPAEDTPLSALVMAELAGDAGIPNGVFNVVPTSRPADVGGELTSSPTVRKISFTGSTEIGRLLLQQAAGTIKKVSMELGGNAPFIVFDDADLDAAADGLMASKFRNAGQTCVCANRIFVHSKIMDEFAEKVLERVAKLKVAGGDVEGAEIGPLINGDAVAKVERLVGAAQSAGARLVTGGQRHTAGKLFYQPTIMSGVTPSMDIAREEIFGPVAAIIAFDNEQDVVAMANNTPYGLAAYAYTRDLGRAWRVSEALEYGMVGVNEGVISSAAAPFGGVKQSGMGREGSRYGIDDYLELKYIMMGGLGA
ncbi:NAD-dependent succinate-semialdehyde dehydrogenase [Hyphomonas sp.]|uniref:NAD-dependent succinate-semialdehyde dehydrogenase n=1 Tax=Hyphomonas sp. TaxID=87 RepID=UPI0032EE0DB0